MKLRTLLVSATMLAAVVGATLSVTPEVEAQAAPKVPTTTRLSVGKNPLQEGQAATFTATVAPVARVESSPAGDVEFLDGPTVIGTATLEQGDNGLTATLSISTLAVGPHPISARYVGNEGFGASTSQPTLQFVTAKP